VWGLKGRFDEDTSAIDPDRTRLNEYARELYHEDIINHVEALNSLLPADGPRLFVPDVKFHRAIGRYKDECHDLAGQPVPAEQYPAYLASVLPTEQDRALLAGIFKTHDWIAPHTTSPRLESHRHA
jgi:hypothetical protein